MKLWPFDYLRPGLGHDHCADVLLGSYDVPFNPATPPVILDIGANIGAFTRWASLRWPGCEIHAYEPNPDNFALLKRTVAEICLRESVQARTYHTQVANRRARAELFNGRYNCGEHSLFGSGNGRGSVTVDVIPADELPRADILKMDTEGAEPMILSTLLDAGRLRELSAIMFEFHHDTAAEAMVSMLISAGFVETGRKVISQHRGEVKFVRDDVKP